jgi:hypothetical protein
MGFAAVNKIFLVFKEPWWTPDIKGFQLVWSKDNNVTPSPKEVSIKQLISEYLTVPSCFCKEKMYSFSSSSLYGE